MKTVIKGTEILSGLLLLLFGFFNPHGELSVRIQSSIEALAAFFVAWAFPRRPAAFVVALVLAAVVVIPAVVRTILHGIEVTHIDSPVAGFAFFPNALLVIAQVIAAYAVLRRRGASR
jgi:fumarate reductase subunit D